MLQRDQQLSEKLRRAWHLGSRGFYQQHNSSWRRPAVDVPKLVEMIGQKSLVRHQWIAAVIKRWGKLCECH